jgi:hypothetical protein
VAPGEWSNIREMLGVGNDVYILSSTALSVVRGDSTTREVITENLPDLHLGHYETSRYRINVDASYVYLATASGVARVSLADGTVEPLYEGLADGETASDIIPLETELVFAIYPTGIFRMPLDGSAAPELVTDQVMPLGFAVDNSVVYAASDSSVISVRA